MRELIVQHRSLLAQIGVLLALVLVFFSDAIFSYRLYFYYDTIMQNFPFGQFFADGFRQFEVRLWCPHIFSGFPLFAEGQTGAMYPLFAPLLLLAPFWVIYKYSVAIHSLLAGIMMLVFLRQMRLKPQSCLLGAVAFAFSGFFVAQVTHLNIIRGYGYLPGILAAAETLRTRGIRRWWLIPILFGSFLLGTHPYIAVYLILATGLWLLFGLFDGSSSRRFLRLLLVIGGLAAGLGIAACQLLPGAELLSHSARGEDVSLEFLTAGSLPLRNLITFLLPNFFGAPSNNSYWGVGEIGLFAEFCGYAGLLTLALAAVGILFSAHRKVVYFAVLLVVGMLLALGGHTPLYVIAAKVPILNATRTPARFIYLVVFALSALAAFGVEHLLSSLEVRPKRLLVGGVTIASFVGAAGLVLHVALPNLAAAGVVSSNPQTSNSLLSPETLGFFERYGEALRGDVVRFIVIAAASLALLLAIVFWRKRANTVAYALPVLLFIDLFAFGFDLNPSATTKVYTKPRKLARFLQMDGDTFRTLRWRVNEIWQPVAKPDENQRRADPFTPGWDDGLDKYRDSTASLVPNTNMIYDIDAVDGYTSFLLSRYNKMLRAPGKCAWPRFRPSPGMMSLLNVKYVISSDAIENDLLLPVFTDKDLFLYRYANFLPRFFLVKEAVVLPADEDVVSEVTSNEFSPFAGVLLDSAQLEQLEGVDPYTLLTQWPERVSPEAMESRREHAAWELPGDVSVLKREPDEIELRLEARQASWLVISENDYPGWKAFVNGRPAPLMRAYGFVKAVPVPKGSTVVRLVFEPRSFRLGVLVSLICVLIVTCVAFATSRLKLDAPLDEKRASVAGKVLRWVVLLVAIGMIMQLGAFHAKYANAATGGLDFGRLVTGAYCDAAAEALNEGENQKALEACELAARVGTGSARAHYLLGVAHFRLGDPGAARKQWERSLALDPGYGPALRSIRTLGRNVPGGR